MIYILHKNSNQHSNFFGELYAMFRYYFKRHNILCLAPFAL